MFEHTVSFDEDGFSPSLTWPFSCWQWKTNG